MKNINFVVIFGLIYLISTFSLIISDNGYYNKSNNIPNSKPFYKFIDVNQEYYSFKEITVYNNNKIIPNNKLLPFIEYSLIIKLSINNNINNFSNTIQNINLISNLQSKLSTFKYLKQNSYYNNININLNDIGTLNYIYLNDKNEESIINNIGIINLDNNNKNTTKEYNKIMLNIIINESKDIDSNFIAKQGSILELRINKILFNNVQIIYFNINLLYNKTNNLLSNVNTSALNINPINIITNKNSIASYSQDIYSPGGYVIKFRFKLDSAMLLNNNNNKDNFVYVLIKHSNFSYDLNELRFVASSCDFTNNSFYNNNKESAYSINCYPYLNNKLENYNNINNIFIDSDYNKDNVLHSSEFSNQRGIIFRLRYSEVNYLLYLNTDNNDKEFKLNVLILFEKCGYSDTKYINASYYSNKSDDLINIPYVIPSFKINIFKDVVHLENEQLELHNLIATSEIIDKTNSIVDDDNLTYIKYNDSISLNNIENLNVKCWHSIKPSDIELKDSENLTKSKSELSDINKINPVISKEFSDFDIFTNASDTKQENNITLFPTNYLKNNYDILSFMYIKHRISTNTDVFFAREIAGPYANFNFIYNLENIENSQNIRKNADSDIIQYIDGRLRITANKNIFNNYKHIYNNGFPNCYFKWNSDCNITSNENNLELKNYLGTNVSIGKYSNILSTFGSNKLIYDDLSNEELIILNGESDEIIDTRVSGTSKNYSFLYDLINHAYSTDYIIPKDCNIYYFTTCLSIDYSNFIENSTNNLDNLKSNVFKSLYNYIEINVQWTLGDLVLRNNRYIKFLIQGNLFYNNSNKVFNKQELSLINVIKSYKLNSNFNKEGGVCILEIIPNLLYNSLTDIYGIENNINKILITLQNINFFYSYDIYTQNSTISNKTNTINELKINQKNSGLFYKNIYSDNDFNNNKDIWSYTSINKLKDSNYIPNYHYLNLIGSQIIIENINNIDGNYSKSKYIPYICPIDYSISKETIEEDYYINILTNISFAQFNFSNLNYMFYSNIYYKDVFKDTSNKDNKELYYCYHTKIYEFKNVIINLGVTTYDIFNSQSNNIEIKDTFNSDYNKQSLGFSSIYYKDLLLLTDDVFNLQDSEYLNYFRITNGNSSNTNKKLEYMYYYEELNNINIYVKGTMFNSLIVAKFKDQNVTVSSYIKNYKEVFNKSNVELNLLSDSNKFIINGIKTPSIFIKDFKLIYNSNIIFALSGMDNSDKQNNYILTNINEFGKFNIDHNSYHNVFNSIDEVKSFNNSNNNNNNLTYYLYAPIISNINISNHNNSKYTNIVEFDLNLKYIAYKSIINLHSDNNNFINTTICYLTNLIDVNDVNKNTQNNNLFLELSKSNYRNSIEIFIDFDFYNLNNNIDANLKLVVRCYNVYIESLFNIDTITNYLLLEDLSDYNNTDNDIISDVNFLSDYIFKFEYNQKVFSVSAIINDNVTPDNYLNIIEMIYNDQVGSIINNISSLYIKIQSNNGLPYNSKYEFNGNFKVLFSNIIIDSSISNNSLNNNIKCLVALHDIDFMDIYNIDSLFENSLNTINCDIAFNYDNNDILTIDLTNLTYLNKKNSLELKYFAIKLFPVKIVDYSLVLKDLIYNIAIKVLSSNKSDYVEIITNQDFNLPKIKQYNNYFKPHVMYKSNIDYNEVDIKLINNNEFCKILINHKVYNKNILSFLESRHIDVDLNIIQLKKTFNYLLAYNIYINELMIHLPFNIYGQIDKNNNNLLCTMDFNLKIPCDIYYDNLIFIDIPQYIFNPNSYDYLNNIKISIYNLPKVIVNNIDDLDYKLNYICSLNRKYKSNDNNFFRREQIIKGNNISDELSIVKSIPLIYTKIIQVNLIADTNIADNNNKISIKFRYDYSIINSSNKNKNYTYKSENNLFLTIDVGNMFELLLSELYNKKSQNTNFLSIDLIILNTDKYSDYSNNINILNYEVISSSCIIVEIDTKDLLISQDTEYILNIKNLSKNIKYLNNQYSNSNNIALKFIDYDGDVISESLSDNITISNIANSNSSNYLKFKDIIKLQFNNNEEITIKPGRYKLINLKLDISSSKDIDLIDINKNDNYKKLIIVLNNNINYKVNINQITIENIYVFNNYIKRFSFYIGVSCNYTLNNSDLISFPILIDNINYFIPSSFVKIKINHLHANSNIYVYNKHVLDNYSINNSNFIIYNKVSDNNTNILYNYDEDVLKKLVKLSGKNNISLYDSIYELIVTVLDPPVNDIIINFVPKMNNYEIINSVHIYSVKLNSLLMTSTTSLTYKIEHKSVLNLSFKPVSLNSCYELFYYEDDSQLNIILKEDDFKYDYIDNGLDLKDINEENLFDYYTNINTNNNSSLIIHELK